MQTRSSSARLNDTKRQTRRSGGLPMTSSSKNQGKQAMGQTSTKVGLKTEKHARGKKVDSMMRKNVSGKNLRGNQADGHAREISWDDMDPDYADYIRQLPESREDSEVDDPINVD
ncbi:uncharacterized protein LOC131019506 [Salvia miltiorrhiza]|uniref:uncharacterized protein LOC131019506 n=1 Tax=Salvia miltiorrhiza TaxID=226208 RepID=UPI0025AB9039|nr:uncharacterized protein LOC131019506 [Salvia miltiorrhiza]